MSRLLRLSVLYSVLLLPMLVAGVPSFAQTADFTISPATGCGPLTVYFTDNSSGTITSYSWNLGNSVTSPLQNPSTTYSTPGTYTITLTVNGPGGPNTKTGTVTIYSKPTVSLSGTPVAGCTPLPVQFSSTVTLNAPGSPVYTWDFGDGYPGTGANPPHTFATAGVYPVSLTISNSTTGAGCDTTIVRNSYITAYPKPSGGFSASQNAFCNSPATVTFTNTSSGGVSPYTTFWLFGDGGNGSGTSITHTYSTGGSFTVTMIVTDSRGCADTVVNPGYITVIGTVPTFTAPSAVCVDATANFVNTTSGASGGATWDFDDGFTTTGNNVTHVYSSSGTYNVLMTVIIGGCVKTLTKTVVVNPKPIPVITMSPSIPCPAPVMVSFSASTSGAAAATYNWKWNSGGTASGQTVPKNYTSNITDKVTVVTTSAAGCTDSVTMDTIMIRNILVNIHPGSICDPQPYSGCFPFTVSFDVELLSSLPTPPAPCAYVLYPLPAITWLWDFGDGSPTSTSPTPTHTFTPAGTYTVTCKITTPNGCTATGSRFIHADTPVHPSFTGSPLTVCPNDPVKFINTTAIPLVNTDYSWEFVDDTVITKHDTSSVINRFEKPKIYTVRLYSNHRGCIDTFSRYSYIVVNPPGANFTTNVHCAPSRVVEFTNTSDRATSQLWDFGDGTPTSNAVSPIHNYAATGTYRVRLVAYNSTYGCTDTLFKVIVVFSPTFDFINSDSTVCTNDFVRFQAAFSGFGVVKYSWLFDSYQTLFDTTSTIDYQYTTKGFHNVALIAQSGNNCLDTLKKSKLILVSSPAVAFTVTPPIGCEPLSVLFKDVSTNAPTVRDTFFRWTFGDGGSISGNVPITSHVYPIRGTYTVKLLVVDSLNCADSLTYTNYVSVHKPHAAFTVNDDSVCAHVPVLFNSTSTGTAPIRHRWDFGDGTFDTGFHPVHAYAKSGSFTVHLLVIDTVGCTDTLTYIRPIYVDAPTAAFTLSDSLAICPPLQVTFTNMSTGAVGYIWDFGSGTQVVVPNPVHTFSTSGLYNVYLVATNINGCTDTARATVRVLGYSGAFNYAPIEGCAPMTVNFSTPIGGIPQITWDFGDGATTTTGTSTATHTYASPGAYVPKAIFSDGKGCTSASAGLDTIKADKLKADFKWSVPCAGAPFSLADNSSALYHNAVFWKWHFGGSDTGVGSPVFYTFSTPGNHPVTLIATNATGCKDTITKQVFINDLPNVKAPDDDGVCPGDKDTLVAKGAVSYVWTSTAAVRCIDPPVCDSVEVSPTDTTIYTVTGTDANGCVNKDEVKRYIQLRTTAAVGPGGEICVGESFRLHAEGARSYVWRPAGTIDSPFIASPLATPEASTTYIVEAREGTCDVLEQSVRVVVHSLPLFSAGVDEIIGLGSAVTLQPTQSGITRIEWRSDTTLSCWDCFRPNAHPIYTTTYYATGYNEFGCNATDSVTVFVRCNGSLVFIPNTFTPNGDGINDYFFPRGKGIHQMTSFRVFNRWGELVFERTNVALNDERAGWDGTYKGKALPPDVYVYTMQSRCETGEPLSWKGDITLMK